MVGVLVAFAVFVSQWPTGPTTAEVEAIKKLDFLVGTWEGEGWMIMPGGAKEIFNGTEIVQKKLHGKALLIEGRFTDKVGKVVHETLAVVTYDERAKKYTMQTYLFNRPGGQFDLTVKPNGFSWRINIENGPKTEYDMNLVDGAWVETGKVNIPNGPQGIEFLGMNLKKRK
jgi:hypothetical protein